MQGAAPRRSPQFFNVSPPCSGSRQSRSAAFCPRPSSPLPRRTCSRADHLLKPETLIPQSATAHRRDAIFQLTLPSIQFTMQTLHRLAREAAPVPSDLHLTSHSVHPDTARKALY
ncbi:unnamed protein product, partial [Iphiclides podalirius]